MCFVPNDSFKLTLKVMYLLSRYKLLLIFEFLKIIPCTICTDVRGIFEMSVINILLLRNIKKLNRCIHVSLQMLT